MLAPLRGAFYGSAAGTVMGLGLQALTYPRVLSCFRDGMDTLRGLVYSKVRQRENKKAPFRFYVRESVGHFFGTGRASRAVRVTQPLRDSSSSVRARCSSRHFAFPT